MCYTIQSYGINMQIWKGRVFCMEAYSVRKLTPSVTLHRWGDRRFKTMKLSVNLIVPMRQETAAIYGILPGVITRATREYPTYQALNRRLCH